MADPRVFVSSVVDGFGEYREAARTGILAAGGHAVLVNEDFPALTSNPRNACLDGVDSCDVFVCLIGARGGWKAPSGILVTEEEYRHAKRRGIPTLVFLVEGPREPEAQVFADRVSDYVSGKFRVEVAEAGDLQEHIARALNPIFDALDLPMTSDSKIREVLERAEPNVQDTILRTIFAPERTEEVVDPVRFGDRMFVESLYVIGHRDSVRLFDYRRAKRDSVSVDQLIIEQDSQGQRGFGREFVRVQLDDSGLAVIDANVTGRMADDGLSSAVGSMVVVKGDIAEVAAKFFAFYRDLFQELDPYERHIGFRFDAALLGLDYRTIVDAPSTGGSQTMRMAMDKKPLVAFGSPRRLSRAALRDPGDEIDRMIVMLERRA